MLERGDNTVNSSENKEIIRLNLYLNHETNWYCIRLLTVPLFSMRVRHGQQHKKDTYKASSYSRENSFDEFTDPKRYREKVKRIKEERTKNYKI